jgi:hypothetical protein
MHHRIAMGDVNIKHVERIASEGLEILLHLPIAVVPREGGAKLAAIEVARAQKTRSFELRAALALAKLYPSAGRALEAHDALAPGSKAFRRRRNSRRSCRRRRCSRRSRNL